MGAPVNDLRDAIELGWIILSAIISAVFTLMIQAFRIGGKIEKLATKKELESYLPRREFDAHVLDLKSDLQEIKELNEKRHSQIIDILVKGGGK